MAATSLANLKKGIPFQWTAGKSGNPGGRPKSAELSRAYREILSESCPLMPELTYAQAIAVSLALSAVRGNLAAAAELCDRSEGRAITPKPSIFNGFGL